MILLIIFSKTKGIADQLYKSIGIKCIKGI